ncbi:nuclear transport factor 2 family protein [Ornithinimicrobium sp. F0845]|uniref:nuclear transport factor 2 family protein n=1 Tax=Ornithinimicrobium sp. F0845 TaxID=2926412 RepID=UPI001FF47CA1|nr:nuclear transport factor 2 family protein [Ornithinimicrobium sp. F0845]MCK0111727.1 nuclear transport factor 2 family protein [Ornithinimicrobium sp. F0845]
MTMDTGTLLAEQVALLERGDAAGLASRYHPEGVVLHEGGAVQGGAILELFTEAVTPPRRVIMATEVCRTEDTLLYDVVQDVAGDTVRVVGSFVLRDGLIWRHTSLAVPVDG